MKKITVKRTAKAGSLLLVLAVAFSSSGAVLANAAVQKDETVYVSLDSAGGVDSTTVSDWLHADGVNQISDETDLQNIQNVKSDETPAQNGNDLTWTLDSGSSDIYYEGTTSKKSPLDITVSYTLNGNEISPDQIAGKSGKVQIKISVKNNDEHTVSVNGKDTEMYTPMTAVVAADLPTDTFSNVSVSEGKIISDGNSQFISFVTMPGLSESLDLKDCGIPQISNIEIPEETTITADAENFTMGSIMIVATPELLFDGDLEGTDSISGLQEQISKLVSLQDDMQQADPQQQIQTLFTDPDNADAARLLINDVFNFYSLDTRAVDIMPEYVTTQNIGLLERSVSDVNQSGLMNFLGNDSLLGLTKTLTPASLQNANRLLSDYDALESFDVTKLDGIMQLLQNYDSLSGDIGTLMTEAQTAMGCLSQSDLEALNALGDSSVQNSLTDSLNSMNALSQIEESLGLSGTSIQFEKADVQALLQSYLGRNFATLAAQLLESGAVNGNITVGGMMTQMQSLGLTSSSAGQQFLAAVEQQPVLLQSFLALNPDASVPASALSRIQTDSVITPAVLQQISAAIQGAGLIGTDGNISVSALFASMPSLTAAFGNAVVSDLQQQLIPLILSENASAKVSAAAVESAFSSVIRAAPADETASMISSVAGTLADQLTSPVNSLLKNSAELQAELKNKLGDNYVSVLSSTLKDAASAKSALEKLQSSAAGMQTQLSEVQAVLSDRQNMDYLIGWAGKLESMKADLDANSQNIAVLRTLLSQIQSGDTQTLLENIPVLEDDLNSASPVLQSLMLKMQDPGIAESFASLPQTTAELMKIEKDVNDNKKVMNIMQLATQPDTVDVFSNAFGMLNGMTEDNTAGQALDEVSGANDLLARKDAYVKLSEDYGAFTQASDGTETNVKFIYKTASISVGDSSNSNTAAVVDTAQQQQSTGFFGWLQSVWSSIAHFFSSIF